MTQRIHSSGKSCLSLCAVALRADKVRCETLGCRMRSWLLFHWFPQGKTALLASFSEATSTCICCCEFTAYGCCNGQEHDVRRVSFTSRCCNGYDYITLHSCLAFQANSCAGIKIANKTVPTITLAQSDFDQNPLKRRYQTSCFRHAHSEKDMVSRIRDV